MMTVVVAAFLAAAQEAREPFPDWSVGGSLFETFTALAGSDEARRAMPEDGFVGEVALHGTGYLSERVTVRLGACYGCHGLTVSEAYGELRLGEALSLRAGRFNVPFGGYAGRHDPTIEEANSKPLPYAMGRMPRGVEFNQGVVPAPLVDTGVVLGARLEPADLELFAVRGLHGGAADFDYVASRDFEENNQEAMAGSRLLFDLDTARVGGSLAYGHSDPAEDLPYWMAGGELQLSNGPLRLRAEYLWRRNFYRLGPEEESFVKQGYYVQATLPAGDRWSFILRQDGLAVEDLFLSPAGPSPVFAPGSTDDANNVFRYTAGATWRPHSGLLVKVSAEFWDFSDFPDTWVFHAGLGVQF